MNLEWSEFFLLNQVALFTCLYNLVARNGSLQQQSGEVASAGKPSTKNSGKCIGWEEMHIVTLKIKCLTQSTQWITPLARCGATNRALGPTHLPFFSF